VHAGILDSAEADRFSKDKQQINDKGAFRTSFVVQMASATNQK